ncbi:MAG: hypothetical protein RIE06_06085 [Roseibium album]|uniref:hypothetical protein n=1 Tax=Roseibium album TaxID=311410 RepID=UPI00131F3D17
MTTIKSSFIQARLALRVSSADCVVSVFLSNYPGFRLRGPIPGDQGCAVCGMALFEGTVQQLQVRLAKFDHLVDLRVGRNISIPSDSGQFDSILVSH